MDYKDYYEVFGVSRNADADEIRQAYRRLARQYHPDVNRGDKQAESRFKEINEAYEVLGDPAKRRKYDQLGVNWQAYQRAGQGPGGFDWGPWAGRGGAGRGNVDSGDFHDLFGDGRFSEFFQAFFANAGAANRGTEHNPRPQRGRDIEQTVSITLEEAYNGTQRLLTSNSRRLEVKIPPGVQNGSRVRVAGEGQPGRLGGAPGDLYLVIDVQTHSLFQRDGDDVRCQVAVDLFTAVLGGQIDVRTLTGRGALQIPPGTQPGQVFRLRGQGMPVLNDPERRGNLLAKIQVRIPTQLTEKEKSLFQELANRQS